MKYGYARVSPGGKSESVDAQARQLTKAGCKKVFRDVHVSGAKTDRAQLRRVIEALEPGDVLMVTRLDRLARSTRDLLNTLAAITGKKAGFRSLGDTWADTTTSHGRLMLTVLGGLAEFERDLIRARTGEGRERAKARGVKMGRKPKLTPHQRAGSDQAPRSGRAVARHRPQLQCQPSDDFEAWGMSNIIASVLACAVMLELLMALRPAYAEMSEDTRNRALTAITDAAEKICGSVPTSGEQDNVVVKGAVSRSLGGLAKKLANLQGVSATGDITSKTYEGLLQGDLPAAIKDARGCKLHIFDTLQERLLSTQKPEGASARRVFRANREYDVIPGKPIIVDILLREWWPRR